MQQFVSELIKWVRDSNRPAIVLFVVSGALLLLRQSWSEHLGMAAWVQTYKPWAVVTCALSFVWLTTYPFMVWSDRRKKIERIRHCAQEERHLLNRFISYDTAVESFPLSQAPSAISLIRDSILFETGKIDREGSPYIGIDHWTFKYLRKHKELIESKPKT